jgi:hypothetical protein
MAVGDPNRFRFFADLIETVLPTKGARIADVASGRGKLQGELYRRGIKNVVAYDGRRRNAKGKPHARWWFDYRTAPDEFDLVVGMHPDEATDQIIRFACEKRKPFVVCPCCVLPTAIDWFFPWLKTGKYDDWVEHLIFYALGEGMTVEEVELPIKGRSKVLIGKPDLDL